MQSILRNIRTRTYIDTGANHPLLNNNTYFFYERGWSGLAVDPNIYFEPIWKLERPQDIFVPEVVSRESGDFDYYKFPDSMLNGIDASQMEKYSERFHTQEIIIEKKHGRSLYDLKNSYIPENEIHFLSVDVVGAELDVLFGAKLTEWKPGAILIETKNLSIYKISDNKIVNYLTSIGYRLISITLLDAFFVLPQKKYLAWIPKTIILNL